MANKITKIIVEGADQQGKSEMCDYLADKLGWQKIVFAPPSLDFNFHEDYLLPDFCISDRNYISEIAYRTMLNEPVRIKSRELLEAVMRDDTLLILMDRRENYKYEDRDELFSRKQILKVRKIYRKIWKSLDMNKLTINPHDENPAIDALINLL